jgi:hypothetical protein
MVRLVHPGILGADQPGDQVPVTSGKWLRHRIGPTEKTTASCPAAVRER